MNTEIGFFCDRLVTAAVNGGLQGILLAVLIGLGLGCMRRTNATTRHAVWFASFILIAALIPAQCWRRQHASAGPARGTEEAGTELRKLPGLRTLPDTEDGIRNANELAAGRETLTPREPESDLRAGGTTVIAESAEATRPISSRYRGGRTQPGDRSPRAAWMSPEPRIAEDPASGSLVAAADPIAEWPAQKPLRHKAWFPAWLAWPIAFTSPVPPYLCVGLVAAWLAVGGCRTGLLGWQLRRLRRVKAEALVAGAPLNELVQRLCEELGVRRQVELKVSATHQTALVLGFLHPVILLPTGQAASASDAELEAVLRHELAHIRRGDDWMNLVQKFIQAALCFHPAIGWISRRLSLEREIACDDIVLERAGGPRPYALLLAELAGRFQGGSQPVLAPGVSNSKSQLHQRIDMILNTKRNTSSQLAKARLGMLTTAAAMLAGLALYSAPRLVLAQTATPAPAPASKSPPAAANFVPDDSPGGPATPDTGTAPKSKPEDAPPLAPQPVPRAPAAPVAAVPAVPATPPVAAVPALATVVVSAGPVPVPSSVRVAGPVMAAGGPANRFAPVAVQPPAPAEPEGSVEARLARLERMVKELLAQTKAGHGRVLSVNQNVVETKRATATEDVQQLTVERAAPQARLVELLAVDQAKQASMQAKQAADQARQAEFQAAKAEAQARQAADQANKAARADVPRPGGYQVQVHHDPLQPKLDALQQQRKALEREMEKIERQIDRLEQEQEKMQQEMERASKAEAAEPKGARP